MTLKVIGFGVGRTGTHSLKLALNRLGFGPCHHMAEVLHNLPVQVPLWVAADRGRPDWRRIYDGYTSAVDWPTAGFCRELVAAYPEARFLLSRRPTESWVDSYAATIDRLLRAGHEAPPEKRDWMAMGTSIIEKTGFPVGLDRAGLARAFDSHNAMVEATVPAGRLLVYEVRDGWAPLCAFLGVPVPDEPFPRTNDRREFWDLVTS